MSEAKTLNAGPDVEAEVVRSGVADSEAEAADGNSMLRFTLVTGRGSSRCSA